MPTEQHHWLSRDTVDGWKRASDRFASWFDWTAPNLITMAHILAAPLIAALLAAWLKTGSVPALALAAVVTALALLSDWLDGALARLQHEMDGAPDPSPEQLAAEEALPFFDQLRRRGRTVLGKKLDPIADKATFYSVLLPLGVGFLPGWLIAVNAGIALALTAIRWKRVMRALGLRDAGSNWFGKRKMWAEVFVISALVLLIPWPTLRWWASTGTLLVATAFALLSFAGHLVKGRIRPAGSRS